MQKLKPTTVTTRHLKLIETCLPRAISVDLRGGDSPHHGCSQQQLYDNVSGGET